MSLTQEDFMALSNLFDIKLQPVKDDILEIKQDVAQLNQRVSVLEENVSILKDDVAELKTDVAVLKDDVFMLKKDNTIIKENIKFLMLQNENDILPRLQTIESCYLSTYNRYKTGITQIDQLQYDVDALKTTVKMHSIQLEKIC